MFSGVLEQDAIGTAAFLNDVDMLFDSFNGKSDHSGKELRSNIQENSPHLEYWSKAFQMVRNWKFNRLLKNGQVKESKPPSQLGWLISLNAIRGIWAYMRSKGCEVLRPRSLNQDPLENLFGSIRSGCGCNDNPSAFHFIGSLKAQILNNLFHTAHSTNCEADEIDVLSNLRSFLESDSVEKSISQRYEGPFNIISEVSTIDNIEADVIHGNTGTFSVAYVAGYILKGLYKRLTCDICVSFLSSDDLELHNIYISNREWVLDKNKLIYPSIQFTICVGHGITALENFLQENANVQNIPVHASESIRRNIDLSWLNCELHSEEAKAITVMSIFNIGIGWWVKRENEKFKEIKNQLIKSKKLKKIRNM